MGAPPHSSYTNDFYLLQDIELIPIRKFSDQRLNRAFDLAETDVASPLSVRATINLSTIAPVYILN